MDSLAGTCVDRGTAAPRVKVCRKANKTLFSLAYQFFVVVFIVKLN